MTNTYTLTETQLNELIENIKTQVVLATRSNKNTYSPRELSYLDAINENPQCAAEIHASTDTDRSIQNIDRTLRRFRAAGLIKKTGINNEHFYGTTIYEITQPGKEALETENN